MLAEYTRMPTSPARKVESVEPGQLPAERGKKCPSGENGGLVEETQFITQRSAGQED